MQSAAPSLWQHQNHHVFSAQPKIYGDSRHFSKIFCRSLLSTIAMACHEPHASLFQLSNQTMKPTAPERLTASVFAADPARGLSLSR